MTMTRRGFGHLAVGAAFAGAMSQNAVADEAAEMEAMRKRYHGGHKMEMEPREKVAILLYPGFTALDLIGPQYCFASMMGASVQLVARTKDPVKADTGVSFLPDVTYDEVPRDLDILFVPGGMSGTLLAMKNRETISFLKDRGERAKWITSVCTGSLVLGAAGLLKGYKATSHWSTREILSELGAIPIDARVVTDRNRMTGAGVTAGIDFGLKLVEVLRGRDYAEAVQLTAEYAPEPPFSSGTRSTASQSAKDFLDPIFKPFLDDARDVAREAMKAL